MLRSTPCGRVGLLFGSSPLATRSVQSAKYLIGEPAELARQDVHHERARLPGLGARHPGLGVAREFTQARRERARRHLAHLMAADAAVVLHQVEPVGLLDLVGNVAVLLAELAGVRDLQHRIPVDRRIGFCRLGLVLRRHRTQVQLLAGLAVDLGGIDKSVAAHPHLVFGFRKVGHDVAALIVSDHHLGVAGRKIGGFCNHPHAGLGAARTGDHAADVVVVNGDRGGCALLGGDFNHRARQHDGDGERRHAEIQPAFRCHVAPLPLPLWASGDLPGGRRRDSNLSDDCRLK